MEYKTNLLAYAPPAFLQESICDLKTVKIYHDRYLRGCSQIRILPTVSLLICTLKSYFEGGICDFSGFSEPEFFQGGHHSFFSDLWYKSSFFEGRDLEQNLDLQNLKIFQGLKKGIREIRYIPSKEMAFQFITFYQIFFGLYFTYTANVLTIKTKGTGNFGAPARKICTIYGKGL